MNRNPGFDRERITRCEMGIEPARDTCVHFTWGARLERVLRNQVENDRVRFAISRRAAEAAGLTVSSKLLRVARDFDEGRRP